MLNLSSKAFDLNTLFSFDSLKEILLELAKSQIKLENEINTMKEENKERDKKIISLNKNITSNGGFEIEMDMNNDENLDIDFENDQDIISEKNENQENNQKIIEDENKNNINDNNQENISNNQENKEDNNKEKKEKINSQENKEIINKESIPSNNNQIILDSNIPNNNNNINSNTNIDINQQQQQKIIPNSISETTRTQNQYQSNPTKTNINNQYNISKSDNTNKIPPSLIKNMMKQIKDQKLRIVKLEENIKKELKNIKEEETKISDLTLENKSEYNLSQEKINTLIQKNQEMEQMIESLQSDMKGLDFMRMFQDDGSGSIDATKVLVKALQEKVFKKFELVEQRYKKDGLENAKTKSTVDNLVPKIDVMKNDLNKINDFNRKSKDEFDEFVKNNENNINEMKDKIYDDINNNIKTLKEEHNNKMNEIEEKLINLNNLTNKIMKDSSVKAREDYLQKEQSKQQELETFKNIENKFIELNKKISIVDNTIKSHLKSPDIDIIKKDITEIKESLSTKITKDSLKEMQNNIITNYNETNDVKDRLFNDEEELNKMRSEIRTAMQKVESFQGNLILMKNNMSTSSPIKNIFDNSKYIEQNKLKDLINPILKELDELSKELYSIKRDMIEGDDQTKNSLKKMISKLDEENKNLLKELRLFIHKRYIEKNYYNKTMKALEIQIKYLTDEKKKDAESWLLGKRNIQCFNCASCEKDIKNENYTTADYLAWKKYPKNEKIHRMGQGFSRMLEMMSEDFAKTIEKNELVNEEPNTNNDNNNMYTNTLPNKDRASSMKIKRNKTEESSAKNLKFRRNLNKMKLPKMFMFKRYDIDGNHISDEENNNRNFDDKDEEDNIEGNPRIIKIFKKANKNEFNSFDNLKEKTDKINSRNLFEN